MSTDDIAGAESSASEIDEGKTEVSSIRENGKTFFNADMVSAASAMTQFTQAGRSSSGFVEAQAIANHAQAGQLLKKRFLLESVLGQGGMGTVYKAKDLRKVEAEDPNPYIATKVLSVAFKDHPSAFVALQQEAAKSHALAHPNIVTVHDFDRDGDILFMTMELLQGEPLDRLLRRDKGCSKAKARSIIHDLCLALAYAHQRHIIHADFKPENVFVCDDGTAKVLDFGIARAASKETQKHKFDTAELGALTPAYATIEMMRDEPLTFADDVYALACVCYEILSGHHPYQNLSALQAKQQGMRLKSIPGLMHNEWKALSRALSVEKKNRIASVAVFMAEFFPRRRPVASTVAILLSTIAVAGATWFGYSQHIAKLKLQNTINENMVQAQTCFAQGDFACALEHSLVVVNLDEQNILASQLIKASQLAQQKQEESQKIIALLNDGESCLSAQDEACAQVKAKEVLSLAADNARAQQLLLAANDLDKNHTIAENIQQAESCLQNNDVACADMFARKAEELNVNHPSVKALVAKLDHLQQQNKLAAQAQQQKIAMQLSLAQDCLLQRKYDCAVQQANEVLTVDAANSKAMEIKQSAAAIQQQAHEAEDKIAKILVQAKDCLEKQKNYSCAIAKAEAVLDVAPNNTDALAIKNRAQDTQRKIKETGFTIK